MTIQVTDQTSIKPSHRYEDDNVKVTIPVYVGISYATAKKILELLRSRNEEEPRTEGSLTVVTAGVTKAQSEVEKRLRVDLYTLRHVLFNSLKTGMSLDLALRIQNEVKDDLVFLTDEHLNQAVANSFEHYQYYAQT